MSEYYQKQIQEILNIIHKLSKSKIIIGIDGLGGSGKSTFARELVERLSDTEIVQMDVFYQTEQMRKKLNPTKEIGSYFDWNRLEREVLIPFSNNLEIRFQKYNWENDSIKDWQNISKNSSMIVEGVYSTRKELSKYYDLRIWIDCPSEIRLQRGIERDGIEMKEYWENVWMKQENEYYKKQRPYLLSDININTSNA